MTGQSIPAYAKLNLFLAVRGLRGDGFHELDMVNCEAEPADRLHFANRSEPGIEISCSDASIPTDARNLVWQAAESLLGQSPNPGLSIRIDKQIPVGAGLGGGSSDAAATLKTVNRIRECGRDEHLPELAEGIGSDVPYSLSGGLCRCRGRGEIVEPIAVSNQDESWLWCLLILPPVSVSTRKAYGWLDEEGTEDGASPDSLIEAIRLRDFDAICAGLHNSFDPVVACRVPAIGRIKKDVMAECGRKPMLSGSGSAMFLLGESEKQLQAIRRRLLQLPSLSGTRVEVCVLWF